MEKTQKQDRIRALERFQQGESVSTIANSLGYSRRWVYKWIERSRVANPEVPWPEDRSRRPHANPRSCSVEMVEAVKLARFHLYNRGLFCGAQAIVWELEEMGLEDHPSVRTINRIFITLLFKNQNGFIVSLTTIQGDDVKHSKPLSGYIGTTRN